LGETYTACGRTRLGRGELELALADLNDAIRLAPDNAEALQLLGISSGRPVKSILPRMAPANPNLMSP
jgi:Flp pilus assembly protein TadD